MSRWLEGIRSPVEIGLLLGKPLIDATGKFSHFLAEDVIRGTRAAIVRATDEFLQVDRISEGRTRWDESESWGRSTALPPPVSGEPVTGRDATRGIELAFFTGDIRKERLYSKHFDGPGRSTDVLTGVSFSSTRGQAAFFKRVRFPPSFDLLGTYSRSGNEVKDFHASLSAWPSKRPIILHADSDPELDVFYVNADVSPSSLHGDNTADGSIMALSPEMFARVVSNDSDIRRLAVSGEGRPIVVISSNAAAPGCSLGQRFAEALQNQEQLRRDVYV
ncbi:hypothetical protein, partial [Nocardia sp. NPDC003345]